MTTDRDEAFTSWLALPKHKTGAAGPLAHDLGAGVVTCTLTGGAAARGLMGF
jgi:hypothetical protein